MEWTHGHDIAGHGERRRYRLALRYVENKCVLDVTCSQGTAMLARRAALVVGADTDRAALAHVRRRYPRPNAIFLQTDGWSFPVRPGSVDIVVWLRMRDPRASRMPCLLAMKSVLAADGLMIVAVPSAAGGATSGWPSLDALRRTFRHVLVLGRSDMACWTSTESCVDPVAPDDRIDRSSTPTTGPTRRDPPTNTSHPSRPHAAVALCSDAPLRPIATDRLDDNSPVSSASGTGLSRATGTRRDTRRREQGPGSAPRTDAPAAGARGPYADLVARQRDTLGEGAQIEMLRQHSETLERRARDLRDMLLSAHEQLLQRDDELQSLQRGDEAVRWRPTNRVRSPGERREGRTARDELVIPPKHERTAQAEYIAMLEQTVATKDAHIATIEARIAELQSHVDRLGQGPIGRIYRLVRHVARYMHHAP